MSSNRRRPPSRMTGLPTVIARSPELQALRQQAADGARIWATARSVLPAALAVAVTPGAVNEGSWPLQASSSAVAAKLKLFAPALLRQLQQQGWPIQRIAVKVSPCGSALMQPPPPPRVLASAAPDAVRQRLRQLRARWRED